MRLAGWKGCEKYAYDGQPAKRLCESVDLALLEYRPELDFSALEQLTNQLSGRVQRANLNLKPMPISARQFRHWIQYRHREIFGGLLPEIAGKLRTEDVIFGLTGGKHERKGSEPAAIADDLEWVFREFEAAKSAPDHRHPMAVFLQRFFEVHPFADGNGRVGRLFLATYADELGYHFSHDRNADEQRYLNALELAHMWRARSSQARTTCRPMARHPSDPLAPLKKYIESVLVKKELDSEIETPPSGPSC